MYFDELEGGASWGWGWRDDGQISANKQDSP